MPLTPYGRAHQEFVLSTEMISLSDTKSLGLPDAQRQYIRNRLIEAFRLGVTKGEEIAAERIAKFVRGETTE